VSWIALTDLLGILERAVGDPTMRGLYHVASPQPITNAQMMATLRRIHGRRFGLSSPADTGASDPTPATAAQSAHSRSVNSPRPTTTKGRWSTSSAQRRTR